MSALRWTVVLGMVFATAALAPGVAGSEEPAADEVLDGLAASTDDQLVAFGKESLLEMGDIVRMLERLDQQVRDRVEGGLLCVTNDLAIARSLLQVSERSYAALIAAANVDRRRVEFEARAITIARKNARLLYADADRCAYGDAYADGKSRVRLEGEPDDDGDAVALPDPDEDVVNYGNDAPNASPW